MKYTNSFEEQVSLADGTALTIRAIHPEDKAALASGFSQLSPESRRQRFNSTKSALTDKELRFLTECDGQDHYALVAEHADSEQAHRNGIGVVRLIRCEDDPLVAEIGITVLDDWQRRGVGRLLLEHIVVAAGERKIEKLRAVVRADNQKMLGLLADTAPSEVIKSDGDLRILEVEIPSARQTDAFDKLLEALRILTLGSMIVPLRLGKKSLRYLVTPHS